MGQVLSAKMKVAVLYSMLPKDLQEKVLDECAMNWDETPEAEAGVLFTKIREHIWNIAKSRREMSGSRPMEVEEVSNGYMWMRMARLTWISRLRGRGRARGEHG